MSEIRSPLSAEGRNLVKGVLDARARASVGIPSSYRNEERRDYVSEMNRRRAVDRREKLLNAGYRFVDAVTIECGSCGKQVHRNTSPSKRHELDCPKYDSGL